MKNTIDHTKTRKSKNNMIDKCPVCGKNGEAQWASDSDSKMPAFKFVHKEGAGYIYDSERIRYDSSWPLQECLIEGIPKGFVILRDRLRSAGLVKSCHLEEAKMGYSAEDRERQARYDAQKSRGAQ